jgi:hypothetical protein
MSAQSSRHPTVPELPTDAVGDRPGPEYIVEAQLDRVDVVLVQKRRPTSS